MRIKKGAVHNGHKKVGARLISFGGMVLWINGSGQDGWINIAKRVVINVEVIRKLLIYFGKYVI